MVILNIKVYTDTICPWCYIGHKNLDKAIELYKKTYPGGSKDEFIFTYSPFFLDPGAPTVAIPWEERVRQKNGADKIWAIRTRLERVGRANGIDFKFNSLIGSTKDSHRVILYAQRTKGHEAAKLLVEEIYNWHFERNGDITSHVGLIEAAVVVGISREETATLLNSAEGGNDVAALASKARKEGVNSVPTIDINGRRAKVDGAGDPQEFLMALIAAREQGET